MLVSKVGASSYNLAHALDGPENHSLENFPCWDFPALAPTHHHQEAEYAGIRHFDITR